MKRFALLLVVVALTAVHTGCRVSNTCCCHQTCGYQEFDQEVDDAVPIPEPAPEPPVAETARASISDADSSYYEDVEFSDQSYDVESLDGACFDDACPYDPSLPAVPVVDQEA